MWGVLDLYNPKYSKNILEVHRVLPLILELFEQYDIHATIAYVGMLNFKDKKALLANLPSLKPNYTNNKLSPYRKSFSYITNDKYFFAPQLIKLICSTPNIEVGTHTFSHYYCMEEGQDINTFEQDLQQAVKQAKINGIKFRSIIFPRNQVPDNYLHILSRYEIKTYRGNPEKLFKKNGGVFQRIIRLLDTFFNIVGYNTYRDENLGSKYPINVPASRFLKPYNKKLAIFDFLKLRRIKNAMTYAAKNGEMYHLWWHPHNFGNKPNNNLKFLKKILQHYQVLNKKYNYQSMTMEKYSDKILNKKKV